MPGPKLDLSGLTPAMQKEFLDGRYVREVHAAMAGMRNQVRLNREADREERSVDGLGRPVCHIDPTVFHHWARREGSNEVWSDKAHLRYMRNHGLQMTKAKGTRVQIQGHDFGGSARPIAGKRFSKTYAL
jgi:hypothetical protein